MATDWIVINYAVQPAIQECRRCGDTAPTPVNCSLDYAADVVKVFLKHHRGCKEKLPNAHVAPKGEE